MPSGNELGANEQWISGGSTGGGIPEAVIDSPLQGEFESTPIFEQKKEIKMEQIYSRFGIAIIKQDEKYFMQYDGGEIVSVIKTIEISEQEAKELQELKDGKAVYEYMIKNLGDKI